MTADSTSWVAESASSTIDPDVQAKRANDGELRAGVHSDLTIDDGAVDGLFTAEECAAEFDENLDDGTLYAEYRRLAAEQAALRRLSTLVARGVEPVEVFGAVADEMRRCVPADTAGLWRFESDREITLVAAAADPEVLARWPLGTRTRGEVKDILWRIRRDLPRHRREHRHDDHSDCAMQRAREVLRVRARTGQLSQSAAQHC